MNKGQITVPIIWTLGIIFSLLGGGIALNTNANIKQDKQIGIVEVSVATIQTDVKWIRESVDELKELQKLQLKASNISWTIATST